MAAADTDKIVLLKGGACPTCGKPRQRAYRPFCSKRCADIDLGHWFNEDYQVPSQEDEAFEEDPYSEE